MKWPKEKLGKKPMKGRAKKRVFGHFVYVKSLQDGQQVPDFVEVHLAKARDAKKLFPVCGERTIFWMPLKLRLSSMSPSCEAYCVAWRSTRFERACGWVCTRRRGHVLAGEMRLAL